MNRINATKEALQILDRRKQRHHATTLLVNTCEVFVDGAFTVADLRYMRVGSPVVDQAVGVAKFNPNDKQVKVGKHGRLEQVSCYNEAAGIRRAIHRAICNAERE